MRLKRPPGFVLPEEVIAAFIQRGWMQYEPCGDEDCDGMHGEITDIGTTIADLNSPEWGISPIYLET